MLLLLLLRLLLFVDVYTTMSLFGHMSDDSRTELSLNPARDFIHVSLLSARWGCRFYGFPSHSLYFCGPIGAFAADVLSCRL
jgi:hypothetical protein